MHGSMVSNLNGTKCFTVTVLLISMVENGTIMARTNRGREREREPLVGDVLPPSLCRLHDVQYLVLAR